MTYSVFSASNNNPMHMVESMPPSQTLVPHCTIVKDTKVTSNVVHLNIPSPRTIFYTHICIQLRVYAPQYILHSVHCTLIKDKYLHIWFSIFISYFKMGFNHSNITICSYTFKCVSKLKRVPINKKLMKKYDTTNEHTKISNYTNMEPKVEGEKKNSKRGNHQQ